MRGIWPKGHSMIGDNFYCPSNEPFIKYSINSISGIANNYSKFTIIFHKSHKIFSFGRIFKLFCLDDEHRNGYNFENACNMFILKFDVLFIWQRSLHHFIRSLNFTRFFQAIIVTPLSVHRTHIQACLTQHEIATECDALRQVTANEAKEAKKICGN